MVNVKKTSKVEELVDKNMKGLRKYLERRLEIHFDKLEENLIEKTNKSLYVLEKSMMKRMSKPIGAMEDFCSKIEELEETFSILYHNIKRNQFLYSKYPEEWWESNYVNFKERLELQNEEYLSLSGVN